MHSMPVDQGEFECCARIMRDSYGSAVCGSMILVTSRGRSAGGAHQTPEGLTEFALSHSLGALAHPCDA